MQDGEEESKEGVEGVEERRGEKERYREGKKEYKKICERKKREDNEKWMEEAKGAKTGQQVRKLINRGRRRRRGLEGGIKELWEEYCKKLLESVDKRNVKEIRRRVNEREN